MKKTLLFGLVLVLVGAGCTWFGSPESDMPVPDEGDVSSGDVLDDPQAENIHVTSPSSGTSVSSPLIVVGEARVFENTFSWRIVTEDGGDVLAEGHAMADAPDVGEFGPFELRIFLPAMDDDQFVLQVFDYSAKDGSIENLVERHLVLANDGKTSVNVFFSDTDQVAAGDCAAVDFEKRTFAQTLNVAELSMQELLKGPTAAWAGTSLPEWTTFEGVSISDGVATVKFSTPFIEDWSGGACKVTAIRAQIESTLLQFSTIDSVVISVNGETEEILQP